MYLKVLANARFLIISVLFLVSACVIGRSDTTEVKPTKAEPKIATAEAKAQPKADAHKVVAPKVATPKGDAKVAKAKEPAKTDLVKVDVARVESAKVQPSKVEPSKVEPAKAEPAKVQTVKAQPAPVKVQRFVSCDTLNVRTSASYTAPVVAKLTRGTMFAVSIKGEWAKIGDGQYVLAKFLSIKEPRAGRKGLASR